MTLVRQHANMIFKKTKLKFKNKSMTYGLKIYIIIKKITLIPYKRNIDLYYLFNLF
jgi:hypothetical protein